MVDVREGVQVFLGGLDQGVAHAVHHGAEVGAAGQQPACVRVTQVVSIGYLQASLELALSGLGH